MKLFVSLVWLVFTIFAQASTFFDLGAIETKSPPAKYFELQQTLTQALGPAKEKVNSSFKEITVLALYSGSKITPFIELDADRLIMVDWQTSGTTEETLKNLISDEDKEFFYQGTFKGGGMGTGDVLLHNTLLAQILLRLKLEMGVERFEVSFEKDKNHSKRTLGENDSSQVVTIQFKYKEKDRSIKLVSYYVTSDFDQRDALPWQDFKDENITWLYLSADGVDFFSAKENGLNQTSRRLAQLLSSKGAILMDFPQFTPYINCSQHYGYITSMCGRGNPGSNFQEILSIDPKMKRLFGYSGFDEKDRIKVFQKR